MGWNMMHLPSSEKNLIISKKIAVKRSSVDGWGVFATGQIRKEEIIEECHLVLLSAKKWAEVDPLLQDYAFGWPRGSKETFGLPFGFGCCYNHSSDANINWMSDKEKGVYRFFSLRDIEAGEELCHNYGRAYWITYEKNKMKEES